jgi:hypothetical protein
MSQPQPRDPFWGYQDLALFAGLAVPSLLFSYLLVLGVVRIAGFHPQTKAPTLLAAQFLAYGLWFLTLWGLLKLRYHRPFWASLGWTRPRSGLWWCVVAGPALALSVAAVGVALRTPEIDMPMRDLLADRMSVLLVGLFATTLGPLCEELAFRGFLLPLVARSLGRTAGVIVAALPFALGHGPQYGWSWRHVLLVALAGVAFGWVRLLSRSTLAAAVVHAGYNLTFFSGYLFLGKDLPARW